MARDRGSPHRALVVEDDPSVRRALATMLRAAGYQSVEAESCAEARRSILSDPLLTAALVDLQLGDGSGYEIIQYHHARDPQANIVVVTGYYEVRAAIKAVKLGARHVLPKPPSMDMVLGALSQPDDLDLSSFEIPLAPLEEMVRAYVRCVVKACGGDKKAASKALRIARQTVYAKLQSS